MTDQCTNSDHLAAECVRFHPVAPEVLAQYSVDGDPDSAQDIARYVEIEASGEVVKHAERVKVEYACGERFDVWDVITDQERWWVITNMTNLYSQEHFPSLDYTLSFHIGLVMRLQSRPCGPDAKRPTPFDEVLRRHKEAIDHHDRAVEVVDYQTVGMQLRECLISLVTILRERVSLAPEVQHPQKANVVAWTEVITSALCSGRSNRILRAYLKTESREVWQLVNWLTHTAQCRQGCKHCCNPRMRYFDRPIHNVVHAYQ